MIARMKIVVIIGGAGFAWYKNYGVEYNFCIDGGENASAIYLMRYNPNMDDMETDHDKYIHYEINFEEKDWKERFLEKWEWFFSIITPKSVRVRTTTKMTGNPRSFCIMCILSHYS